jgi:phosphoribosylformylglycinamidine cyclo-ligase
LQHGGISYTDTAPFDANVSSRQIMRFDGLQDKPVSVGEILLNPTRIYCDPVIDLLNAARGDEQFSITDIRAICHVTGGGLSNLLRLHDSLGWDVSSPLTPHPEFTWLQQVGGVETREMYRTFNMGTGMILAVSPQHAEAICDWLSSRMQGTAIIGSVVDNGHKVTHAIDGVEFTHY